MWGIGDRWVVRRYELREADCTVAADLSVGLAVEGLPADKAYDTDALVPQISQVGAAVVVPSKRSRRTAREVDRNPYADRNKGERFFNRPTQYRRLIPGICAMRRYFHLASTFTWLLWLSTRPGIRPSHRAIFFYLLRTSASIIWARPPCLTKWRRSPRAAQPTKAPGNILDGDSVILFPTALIRPVLA